MKQKTVTNQICARGVARESGRMVNITLKPAGSDHGIVFYRKDVAGGVGVKASIENAFAERGQLVFKDGDYSIKNAEHLLAACYGSGVHNLRVEIDGDELPRMTENASAYVFLLQSAGIKPLSAERKQAAIEEPVLFRRGAGWIRSTEFRGLRVGCVNTLNENAVSVQRSSAVVDISEATFVSELCHAQAMGGYSSEKEALNQQAKKNRQHLAQRSHVNYMVVEVLAYLSLTDADIQTCYTCFDADVSLHLEAVRALKEACHRQTFEKRQVNLA